MKGSLSVEGEQYNDLHFSADYNTFDGPVAKFTGEDLRFFDKHEVENASDIHSKNIHFSYLLLKRDENWRSLKEFSSINKENLTISN